MTPSAASSADSPLPRRSPTAIFKELSEGGVVLSTADQVYFGVNAVGAKIWSLMPPVLGTFGDLYAELERCYPDVEADRLQVEARQFIQALVANGLAIPVPSN